MNVGVILVLKSSLFFAILFIAVTLVIIVFALPVNIDISLDESEESSNIPLTVRLYVTSSLFGSTKVILSPTEISFSVASSAFIAQVLDVKSSLISPSVIA